MADQKPTTKQDTPQDAPQKAQGGTKKPLTGQALESAARARYGAAHGLDGKALDERWSAIPDGLREAFRHQVR